MTQDTQPTVGTSTGEAPKTEPRTFTQDDLNRIDKRARREAEEARKEAESLKAKLAEMETAQKSEAERAVLEAAKKAAKERDDHWQEIMLNQSIESDLRLKLLQAGYDPDLAHVVRAKALIRTTDDIDEAIDSVLSEKGWAKTAQPKPPGQSGTPSGAVKFGQWTWTEIERWRAGNPTGRITKEMLDEAAVNKKRGLY